MSSPEWKEIFDQFNQAHDAIKRTVSILTDRTSFPESSTATSLHTNMKDRKQRIADLKSRQASMPEGEYYKEMATNLEELVKLQDQLIFFPSGLSGAATPNPAGQAGSPERAEVAQ